MKCTSGVHIRCNERETNNKIATGKYSTIFRAEAEAVRTAVEEITGNPNRTKEKVVIFTDFLAVILPLKNHKARN